MKKNFYAVIGLFLLVMMGCSGETTQIETTEALTVAPTTVSYDYHIQIVLGDETFQLGYNDGDDLTVLELIEASDIDIDYEVSDYGAMLTAIGDFKQDDFHWIGFTHNGEYAMSGIDSIAYDDGDVFEFMENLSTWEMTLDMTIVSISAETVTFEIDDLLVFVPMAQVSDTLIGGETYAVTGAATSESESGIEFNLSAVQPISYLGYITISAGDLVMPLTYEDTSSSVLDLIEASDIYLVYDSTAYGAMISAIGDLKQDDFHWLGFTKNDEFAMSGIDSIEYSSGDFFAFTENYVSWEIMLSAELVEKNQDTLVFENSHQSFVVYYEDLPDEYDPESLIVGFIYQMTGTPVEALSTEINRLNPTSITLDVVTDFTDLYSLEEGDVFILEFTVTYIETSSEFGSEIFARDINGLLSNDISEFMPVSSDTDYLFYTIPDAYALVVGETYIGRFIYQVNAPSSVPQLTVYQENIQGETITGVIILK